MYQALTLLAAIVLVAGCSASNSGSASSSTSSSGSGTHSGTGTASTGTSSSGSHSATGSTGSSGATTNSTSATTSSSTTTTASSSATTTASGSATTTASGSATTTASSSSSGSTGATTGGPCALGSSLTTLPACSAAAGGTLVVPWGCAPTVDGAYATGEWADAACITVGNDPVYLKYSGTNLYLAWPMTPACGCPAQLAFNVDGSATLDGNQFDLGIFDDPGSASGDSSEFTSQGGAWTASAAVSTGIVIANPPN